MQEVRVESLEGRERTRGELRLSANGGAGTLTAGWPVTAKARSLTTRCCGICFEQLKSGS